MQSADINSFYTSLLNEMSQNNQPVGKTCLITGAILEKPVIELDCGHAFNYKPLFEEVRNQKDDKLNNLEIQKLAYYQIKCPYCRTIHNTLLPSLENEEKIVGVNWPQKYTMFLYKCSYILKSGKRKGLPCTRRCNEPMCHMHINVTECSAILLSGKRKGGKCSKTARETGLCRLHENKNKES